MIVKDANLWLFFSQNIRALASFYYKQSELISNLLTIPEDHDFGYLLLQATALTFTLQFN